MKYYIDDNNSYIGGTDGEPLSNNEVSHAPNDARQKWNGSDYDPVVLTNAEHNAQVETELSSLYTALIPEILEWATTTLTAPQSLKDKKTEADALRHTRR